MNFPIIDLIKTGENIKKLREAKGLSVRELAEYMGFTGTYAVYKWQYGMSLPSVDNLVILGKILGVGIDKIIVIEGE